MKQINQLAQRSKKKFTIKKRSLEKGYNFDLYFLIGFPRSGTTLLDTILRTHPSIKVLEEKLRKSYDTHSLFLIAKTKSFLYYEENTK